MPTKPIEYERRTVSEWLEALLDGSLALPRFQRSYVWTDRKIADLIMALLVGRPVGTMLLIDRYTRAVPADASPEELKSIERFAPRRLVGTRPVDDLTPCQELILDGQQRLTSLWRAMELGTDIGLEDTERHERHAFLEVGDISAASLKPVGVVFPRKPKAKRLLSDPAQAANERLIPLRLFNPRNADSTMRLYADPLLKWCRDVSNNNMDCGFDLLNRIGQQLRTPLLRRNMWYAKLPQSVERTEAIEVFIKVNESSAVIRKFDIAVAELDRIPGSRSLREEISQWAEANTHSESFFGPDEEKLIPKVGELILKIACLQEGRVPTDKYFTSRNVIERLRDPEKLRAIFEGIDWTFDFLGDARIWRAKHLPSTVPLRVLPALFPELRAIADASDTEGVARRCMRAYLWRAFITDRYARSANTRLKEDFDALRRVLRDLPEIDHALDELKTKTPIFRESCALPERTSLHDLSDPLAPPTKQHSLSRSLLVASLQKGARDFGSGVPISAHDVGNRQAHHLFPKGFLKSLHPAVTEAKEINHCLNYALVSGPTNRKIAAKAPLDYLRDRYRGDSGLKEDELRSRINSHLIPYRALAVGEQSPGSAYQEFLVARAKMIEPVIRNLADGVEV